MKIGIEVHVQLNTRSKLFCGCSTSGKNEPNSRTCDVCLGMPGSKPVLNKAALNKAIKVALALNCKINKETFFSRKSYFYPDMVKNFQITQYEIPIGIGGNFEGIRIRRLHLEEDPGALIHKGNICLIDYNRSGIPLIEIVTDPDFNSANEVRLFLRKLITMLTYLDVYFKKEETTLKADANISVVGERVEIKNINGLKEIERALDYEILRQEKETPKVQETRGWDSQKGKTYLMRTKESEEDYGYIFEPDLPFIEISKEKLKTLKKEIPELYIDKKNRFLKQYKLDNETADVLSSDIKLGNLYEIIVGRGIDPKLAAKWLRRELLGFLADDKKELKDVDVDEKHLYDILKLFQDKKITDNVAKDLLQKLTKKDYDVMKYVKKNKLSVVSDKNYLEKLCKEVIKENPVFVERIKKGEEFVIHSLIGRVMKKTRGTGDPKIIVKTLKRLLNL